MVAVGPVELLFMLVVPFILVDEDPSVETPSSVDPPFMVDVGSVEVLSPVMVPPPQVDKFLPGYIPP